MTNEAIILIKPHETDNENDTPFILQDINGKPFLHYQLQYLSNNIFEHITIVYSGKKEKYVEAFGESYLDMEMNYIPYNSEKQESENILPALTSGEDLNIFVFNAYHYFRLSFAKAENFRRMRMTKFLTIAKNVANCNGDSTRLTLNEKGRILAFNSKESEEDGIIATDIWFINKQYFIEKFTNQEQMAIIDFVKENFAKNLFHCFACKQYYLEVNSENDFKKARYDFEENYY